jgi:hypothetical protein
VLAWADEAMNARLKVKRLAHVVVVEPLRHI